MKLDTRKVIVVSVAGLFLATTSLWDQFPKDSIAVDSLWVIAFAAGVLLVSLGINQSLYRDNQTLRKMD